MWCALVIVFVGLIAKFVFQRKVHSGRGTRAEFVIIRVAALLLALLIYQEPGKHGFPW